MPAIISTKPADSSSHFLKSVVVLVGGGTFAHGITALTLPVLARLYTPADFGMLAAFSGLLTIIASAACLRFDVAIPLPECEDDALGLLTLAIICVILVALALAVTVALSPEWIVARLNQPKLLPYLWLLPVGVFLTGTYSSLQHWFVRRKLFPIIAHSRIAQSVVSSGTQLCLGWLGFSPLGLLIGYVMNTGMACLMLATRPLKEMATLSRRPTDWETMRKLFQRYDKFPKYSTFEALCNSAAVQLPIVMIAAMATPGEAGLITMAMAVMQAPMALIGSAVGQVYLSRASEELRQGQLGNFTTEILGGLIRSGFGPLLAAGIVAPTAFGLVFGPTWERAGWLVTLMTPWFILQFLASPISMALHVTGHQRAALMLQVFGLLLRVLMVLGASRLGQVTEAYAISGGVFYLIYLLLVLRIIRAPVRGILGSLAGGLRPMLAWGAAAGGAALVLAKL